MGVRYIVALIVVVLVASVVALVLIRHRQEYGPTIPREARVEGFVFASGVDGKNILDTTKGTFTADMVMDPPVTVPMRLTKAEMAEIVAKMRAIDFFSYPTVFVPQDITGAGSPHGSFMLRVITDQGDKVVRWADDSVSTTDPRADRLRALDALIWHIIARKPAFKRLPKPKGGYI
jgi:hypothetical protein